MSCGDDSSQGTPATTSPSSSGSDAGHEGDVVDEDTPSADASDDVADQPDDPELAYVAGGLVRGQQTDGVVAFRGVPFAAPPVGPLRWMPPQPIEAWEGEREALEWPPACAQLSPATQEVRGQEDCLFLNVWAPVDARNAPTIVFIHGGGNMFGSTSEEGSGVFTYEGAKLAQRTGAVVVTLQYRLNIFGYLSHPSFDGELEDPVSANWGLRDQIAGLEWVRDNIGAFGGDPNKTLLFGESGGAASVCGLVATQRAAGLFNAAIMQSGGCGGKTLESIRDWTTQIVEDRGCDEADDVASCMRAVSVEDLVNASSAGRSPNQGFAANAAGPTIDGVLLSKSPLGHMRDGEHNHVPMIFGINSEETAWPFFGIVGTQWDQESYEAHVRAIFGIYADDVLNRYQAGAGEDFFNHTVALIALTTDAQFLCPARTYARAAAQSQEPPVYRYLYTHALEGGANGLRLLGAFHGLELLMNFQHMSDLDNYTATEGDQQLEEAFADLWFNMAAEGAPGEVQGVTWPAYDVETDPYMELAAPLQVKEGMRTEYCDFWDNLFE